jgi:hypothetical protein
MAKKTSKVKPKKTVKKAVRKSSKVGVLAQDKISFDYIKSSQFRVIRVDGAHGGITPKGHVIQMAFFSERQPIPKRETYKLEKGRLSKLIAKEERNAIIREVEVEALIDIETAKTIVKWLEDKIQQAENLRKQLNVK